MKINKKQLQNIFMIVIVIIAMVGFGFLAKHNIDKKIASRNQIYINGLKIDLTPRPFSELLATDFANIKDEPADPNKCDGTKILKFLEGVKDSKAQVTWFKDYDPSIHKLTILDNCWRQYENEYVKFKFRDLNGSLSMDSHRSFNVNANGFPNNLGIHDNNKNGKSYINAALRMMPPNSEFLGMSTYSNPNGVMVLKTEILSHSGMDVRESVYTIDMPGTDRFIYISGYSDRTMKDILSTIEIKK